MKGGIGQNVSSDIVDGVTRRELFRVSAENRLIDAENAWQAFSAALLFIDAASSFIERLEARHD